MQAFKDQAGCTQLFGPRQRPAELIHRPQRRKSIHKSQRTRWMKVQSNLKVLAKEYCSHSTIHGMSYIGSKRTLLERLWWIVVFVLSVYGCARLIENVYLKWSTNPVIVTFDEKPLPVWKIPFPAVTICPEAKIHSKFMNFTEDFYRLTNYDGASKSLDQERLDRLMAVLQICDDFFHVSLNYPELYAQTVSHADVVDILRNLSVDADQTILTCKVNGAKCNELFTETLTDEGICFTFNGYSSHDMFRDGVLHDEYNYLNEPKNVTDWSTEGRLGNGKTLQSHPIRVLGSGFGAGLTMQLITTEKDIEEHCREQQGFKVVIHPPNEYPQVTKKFARVTYSRDVTIAVRPIIFQTSTELRNYHHKRRHCYFNHERQLKFFRVYTQNNCDLECVTNFTLKSCGCVKFSMPRSNGTRLCQTSEIACVLQAEYKMLKRSAKRRLKKIQTYDAACDCISACTSIQYDAEITQSVCDFGRTLDLRIGPVLPSVREAIRKKKMSKLAVYFKEVQFITSKRSELFGLTDFIANCGGILGLCLGVSMFSLVELLYYCLVRPMLLVRESFHNKRSVTIVKESSENRY